MMPFIRQFANCAKLQQNLSDKNRKLYSGRIIEDDMVEFERPNEFVSNQHIESYYEQYVDLQIITPSKFFEPLNFELCEQRRGEFISSENLGSNRLILNYQVPMSESIKDLHTSIKEFCRQFFFNFTNFASYTKFLCLHASDYSSVGRAGDCRGLAVISRSLVRIRLVGNIFILDFGG